MLSQANNWGFEPCFKTNPNPHPNPEQTIGGPNPGSKIVNGACAPIDASFPNPDSSPKNVSNPNPKPNSEPKLSPSLVGPSGRYPSIGHRNLEMVLAAGEC